MKGAAKGTEKEQGALLDLLIAMWNKYGFHTNRCNSVSYTQMDKGCNCGYEAAKDKIQNLIEEIKGENR